MNASRSSIRNQSNASKNADYDDLSEMFLDESVLQLVDEPLDTNKKCEANLRTDPNYKGFDSTMGSTWIYPVNYPMRQYQHNISRVSLFKNTLVVLPTGLGKTFIASVVMYNFFRWYPKGKIIFMAPTRPLVNQQIDACYQIMAFPKDETAELTGKQNKTVRATAWHSKRVFYCTPQVVWADINDNEMDFPINDVKLVVVDEAHKAKGKYAYREVVQTINAHNRFFRVLALTATPGRTMNDVSEVVQNLLISNIEVRRENSIDVQPYVFKKNIKTHVVPLGEQLTELRQRLYKLVEPYVENLAAHQVIGGNINNISKAWLLYDRNEFRKSTVANRHPDQSSINGDFSVCISMFHAIELLERHGMRVFLNYFNDNNPDSNAEEKFFVMKDSNIKQFINEVRQESGIVPFDDTDTSFRGDLSSIDLNEDIDYGHPKFQILQDNLLNHFKEFTDSKAIVFCEYRESVFLINRMLLTNQPLIKPKVFVGQGSSHNRTITQKEQIAIMNDFRSGKCNTLIATCVAEEGIDVGEVDLIVCFDVNNKNPIRFVQRIGRTGRKRQGKVMMLVSEGKEQQTLKEILATKDGINQRIAKSNEINTVLYKNCPRLVPPEFNPQCVETHIEVKNTQPEPSTSKKKATKTKGAKKQTKNAPIKTQKGDVRQFFKPLEIDDELQEHFDLSTLRGNTSANNTSSNSRIAIHGNVSSNEFLCPDNQNSIETSGIVNDRIEQKNENDGYEERMRLKLKVQQLYAHYCDLKKNQSKWNDWDEKLSKPAINDPRVPIAIRELFARHKKESNDCRIFRTKSNASWSTRSIQDQMNILILMSFLRKPEEAISSVPKESQFIDDAPANPYPFDESQFNASLEMEQQSKYASQLKPQFDQKRPAMELFTSSTPQKTLHNRQKPAAPIHSPIVSAPRTEKPLRRQRTRQIDRNDPKWHLKYLGLNSISDLFSDDENDANKTTNDVASAFDSREVKLCDNLNKSVCGNESLAEEESQYTVSRILKICEETERDKCGPVNVESTVKRRKRLYIGSINDLICDDGDDDDDAIINSQIIGVSISSSDDTINYDVDDAIEHHHNPHHSTNLFKDTIEGDVSHRSNAPAKSVTCAKSDELFSTYNETTVNSSKASTSVVKNMINNNQSSKQNREQTPPPTTPNKSNQSFFAYYSRSPSMLIKTNSILTNKFDHNHSDKSACNTSKTSSNRSEKSPTLLSAKLGVLNTQISLSKHFDDFDELKENKDMDERTSPYATCTSATNSHRNRRFASNSPIQSISNQSDDDDDDIFATCRPISTIEKKPSRKVKRTRKARNKFNFIDDEAGVSGDESSDEDVIVTQRAMLNIIEHEEEDDPSVDMQAKYLESVRSPIRSHRFRIPEIGYRNPLATQNIFSQYVAPDQSKYEEDSFVVGSDEDIESDCTDFSDEESESSDFDEITIAEPKSNKRKSDDKCSNNAKKRRRIIEMSSDSD